MRLIVIYGPPAAGKYTIAKIISEITGYKLFHNHLTADLLKSVFTWGTPEFFRLSQKIRIEIIEEAAKQNIAGIIHTFVYEKEADDNFVKNMIEAVLKNNGEVKFIQIYCEQEQLLKRVTEDSRNKFQKVRTVENLQKTLEERDLVSPIGFVDSIKIDNTFLSIDETVKKVLDIIK
jgi:dephospho-CoA kinase